MNLLSAVLDLDHTLAASPLGNSLAAHSRFQAAELRYCISPWLFLSKLFRTLIGLEKMDHSFEEYIILIAPLALQVGHCISAIDWLHLMFVDCSM